jgi:hypothetical protein
MGMTPLPMHHAVATVAILTPCFFATSSTRSTIFWLFVSSRLKTRRSSEASVVERVVLRSGQGRVRAPRARGDQGIRPMFVSLQYGICLEKVEG